MSASIQHVDDPYGVGTAPLPAPAARKTPRRWLIPAGAGILLTLVAFGGGFGVANATAAKPAARTFGGAAGQAGGGGGASGTVASVSVDQMTITTQAGSSRLVLLTPTTTVTQVTSTPASATNIANGNQVTVIGTANPDGSVTATQVVLGNAGIFGRGGRAGTASPAPSATP